MMLGFPLMGQTQVENSVDEGPLLRIGLLADIQYCDCETAGTRQYRLSLGKLEEAVKEFLAEKVDLTVVLGDLIDRDLASFKAVDERLEPLKPDVIIVPGNHDFAVGTGREADRTRAELHALCPAVSTLAGIRMLFLNGMANSIEAWPVGSLKRKKGTETFTRLKSEGAPNAQEWNGGLGKKQLNWVDRQVRKSNKSDQKLFIFCHFPALPGDVHSLWDTPELLRILEQAQEPVVYLCGHNHAGGDHQIGNLRLINLRGMVEQTTNAFGILEFRPDEYSLRGFGRQESID